jgi:dihydrofolate reductase
MTVDGYIAGPNGEMDWMVWDWDDERKQYVKEITLKGQDGKDINAYGGATFVSALIKQELIDEFHLFIDPTAIGNGMTIFKELDSKQNYISKSHNNWLRDCCSSLSFEFYSFILNFKIQTLWIPLN